ncbi:MAG: UTP--glucose-1-phosphate uridylyltransferase GalU [Candidatus Schekmanbacteria bacterium]|nr:UTP--glucose-1-phosphate uridylyltransferase GalU [Candidatus Schekmanbacteria bacterium]
MSNTKVTKAVFPAAGLGTRFLPATKASPKEMLPLVDKPIIQYVLEEAVASGIKTISIVTGRGKRAIEDHFDKSYELEHELERKGKHELLKQVHKAREIADQVPISYIRQKEPLGLGHAILTARSLVGNEPFAVLLGDDIVHSEVPCLKQLIDVYAKYHCPVLAVEKIDRSQTSSYGIIHGRLLEDNVYQVLDLVEKPKPEDAPSDLAIIGRYILTPDIFDVLEETAPDKSQEIQLTDGLQRLLKSRCIYACEFKGKRYDTGNVLGFLQATVEFALRRPDLADEFGDYLKALNINELTGTTITCK